VLVTQESVFVGVFFLGKSFEWYEKEKKGEGVSV